MRKFILILALVTVPFGIWTAGCRNDNRQAAFPTTPEMNALSKNAGKTGDDAPAIPNKAIDRNILNLPENDTLARVQAANDRASQYAAEKAAHGLFTLPGEDNYTPSAFSAPAAAQDRAQSVLPAAAVPMPSAREFWSKPVATAPGTGGTPSEDISAMVPPALPAMPALPGKTPGKRSPQRPRAEITERAPVPPEIARMPETFGTPPPAPSSAFAAFPPIPAGARIVSSAGLEGFEPLPEPIPLEQYTALPRGETASAPKGGFLTRPAPEKRAAQTETPLLPLPAALLSAPGEPRPKTEATPASAAARAFGSAPAAPPLLAPEAPVAFLPPPVRPAAPEGVKPMPKFAELEPTPEKSSLKGTASLPVPAQEALPTPEETALKADPVAFSPEAMDEAFTDLKKSDFFKTDFWNPAAKPLLKTEAKKTATAPSATDGGIPELTDPGEAVFSVKPPAAKPSTMKPPAAEPEKITLRPVRKTRAVPELEQIDSQTEVPPLKF